MNTAKCFVPILALFSIAPVLNGEEVLEDRDRRRLDEIFAICRRENGAQDAEKYLNLSQEDQMLLIRAYSKGVRGQRRYQPGDSQVTALAVLGEEWAIQENARAFQEQNGQYSVAREEVIAPIGIVYPLTKRFGVNTGS